MVYVYSPSSVSLSIHGVASLKRVPRGGKDNVRRHCRLAGGGRVCPKTLLAVCASNPVVFFFVTLHFCCFITRRWNSFCESAKIGSGAHVSFQQRGMPYIGTSAFRKGQRIKTERYVYYRLPRVVGRGGKPYRITSFLQ